MLNNLRAHTHVDHTQTYTQKKIVICFHEIKCIFIYVHYINTHTYCNTYDQNVEFKLRERENEQFVVIVFVVDRSRMDYSYAFICTNNSSHLACRHVNLISFSFLYSFLWAFFFCNKNVYYYNLYWLCLNSVDHMYIHISVLLLLFLLLLPLLHNHHHFFIFLLPLLFLIDN